MASLLDVPPSYVPVEAADPWDLDQLLQGETITVPKMSRWKRYCRIILPHVGLITLSVLYVVTGAAVFYHFEHPHEVKLRNENIDRYIAHKNMMISEIRGMKQHGVDEETMRVRVQEYVENVTRILFEAFETNVVEPAHLKNNHLQPDRWTFLSALFFTCTLLTTIGYGNIVPMTWQGKLFCIAYALLGVPLILITVADIGKFLSENIIWLYTRYTMMRRKPSSRPYTPISMAYDKKKEQLIPGLEHYVSIPISLIVVILLGYITIGAVLLSSWENWEFFSGFYFSFVTMTTVGFGDLVPTRREYYLLDLCYIVVGLAITTMCIDLVGIQYIRKIHYFGRAIKDARFALVNVGGKMVHVPDLMRYAMVLQQKYGQKKNQDPSIVKGAYAPNDISRIRFIDYGALASIDSIHSIMTIFTRKSKEENV